MCLCLSAVFGTFCSDCGCGRSVTKSSRRCLLIGAVTLGEKTVSVFSLVPSALSSSRALSWGLTVSGEAGLASSWQLCVTGGGQASKGRLETINGACVWCPACRACFPGLQKQFDVHPAGLCSGPGSRSQHLLSEWSWGYVEVGGPSSTRWSGVCFLGSLDCGWNILHSALSCTAPG